jgi:hypothetical protein
MKSTSEVASSQSIMDGIAVRRWSDGPKHESDEIRWLTVTNSIAVRRWSDGPKNESDEILWLTVTNSSELENV